MKWNSTFRHRFGANCVSIVYLRLMFKRQNPVFPSPSLPPVGGGGDFFAWTLTFNE